MNRLYLVTALLFVFNVVAIAQNQIMESMPGPIIVCPPGEFDGHHHTPVPAEIMQKILQKDGSEPCANITVVYTGFTPQAQNAFQAAVDIWSYAISSPVTIVVEASWETLDEGVLGAAGPVEVFRDFPNAPNSDYYPVALANQIAGSDLSPGTADIVSFFNSNFDWYYGTDGNAPNNKYDLMSVVLHELGHGLGFISSSAYDAGNNTGSFGLGANNIPLHFDQFLVSGQNGPGLLSMSGTALGNAFTSSNVFCNSPTAASQLGGNQPKIYAPGNYNDGSSISHWDEISFPAGNIHSLMTPQIGPGEAIHNPGPITLAFFEDMGWALCDGGSVGDDCLNWQDPSPSTGWTNFNTLFGGAPCDDGTGCPFNEIQSFEVYAAEAYSVNGFMAGGEYTFSICNGPGAGSWVPDFTIVAPSGAVDASGSGTGCAISWTASESGTYLIVINQAGNCGIPNEIDNGFPALTCGDGTAVCEPSDCNTGTLQVQGETTLCPGETTTVNLAEPASLPPGGAYGILFYNQETESGINLTSASLPYTFDNDLNGLLSANGFDEFLGTYEVTGFIYTDPQDLAGSTCATSPEPVLITFLDANDPMCASEPTCQTDPLVIVGDATICPEETTTVDLIISATIPSGGGYAIDFYSPSLDDGISLTGVSLPYTFDNDLNGLLSANGFDLLEGEYELTGLVYSDENDFEGSICAVSEGAVIVNFLSATDPACAAEEPCATETLVITGDSEICPDETTTVNLSMPATIPTGGGYAIDFFSPSLNDGISLTGVSLPYTFDNDLNGLLSANGFDLLEGEYELTGLVYSDENDIEGSICAVSANVAIVNFLLGSSSECVTAVDETESSNGFVVYPNPASSHITIKLNEKDINNAGFRIVDMGGRILMEETSLKLNADNVYQINVSDMAQGIYLVVLYSDHGIKTNRLIIAK